MQITQVWKRANVSTLLVLPIFDDILDGTKTRMVPRMEFPLLLIAYEYGLEKAYLLRKGSEDLNKLYVKFNEKVCQDLQLTDSNYYSLNERFIDSNYLSDVEYDENHIIYTLDIPTRFRSDIELIVEGKYSSVSKEYKSLLRVKQKHVPSWTNELGHYIVEENLPISIVVKSSCSRNSCKIFNTSNSCVDSS